MVKNNKVCCVDGTVYTYCPSCGADRNKPTWMMSFCCENCRDVYKAVAAYGANKITKDEAKEKLDKCDLSKKETFTASTQRLIEEIYYVEPVVIEEVKKVEQKVPVNKNRRRKRNN